MGMFDLFRSNKGQSSAFGMIADFLANPQKLKDTLLKQLYPHLETALIKHLDSVKLDEGEMTAGIILFKSGDGKLSYVVATFNNNDNVVRQLDCQDVAEKLNELSENIKL
jgi:hypothetical protein